MDSKPSKPERTTYVCAGCGQETTLDQTGVVKCSSSSCSYRVIYKKRTTRIIEHIAR